MNNALWEWYENGKDALNSFYEYAADTFSNIGKEMTREMINESVFSELKDKLKDLTKSYIRGDMSDEDYANSIAGVMQESANTYNDILPKLQSGEWKRVLFVPTGALLSKTSFNEGNSVPGIAHGLVLGHV